MSQVFLPWILLVASQIVLVVTPYLSKLLNAKLRSGGYSYLVLRIVVLGGILFHFLPHIIEHAGWTAILVLIAGAGLAFALDHYALRASSSRLLAGGLVFAFCLHGFVDGYSLRESGGLVSELIGVMVVVHRIFAGLFLWQVCTDYYSKTHGVYVLAGLALVTVAGFLIGPSFVGDFVQVSHAEENHHIGPYFEAFILGGLSHLGFHKNSAKIKAKSFSTIKETKNV